MDFVLRRFKSLNVEWDWQTSVPTGPTGSMRHFKKKEREERKGERGERGRERGKEVGRKEGKTPPIGFIQFMAPDVDFIVRWLCRFTA